MGDLFSVWSDRKRLRFIILTAIVYAALLIPFKPLVITPGFTEIRPANFVPALFGVLFGPAAAWGAGIGNLLADIASTLTMGAEGTLSAGSLFGFAGNFLYAYIAWWVWNLLDEKERGGVGPRRIGYFIIAALAGGAVCALVIGLGVFVLGLKTLGESLFMVMFITLNNLLPSATLGAGGLLLFYERAASSGLMKQAREGARP